ncbi:MULTISPECIES: pimeloyl-ACP methyl ester esterase BioH [unclassified Pseudoalteromonas]|uniref:pimeloyl-ACP methyl ester esterase BioH n=1 Tax=unclassified Pseudoalteromonas TaxID=194690 RepID=UPI00209685D6|nr:pimeloyl-ACP methyl ester esterase BioH [Pseudoalteromonas sp. XMcav2-N]MCO7191138.1 pimeloyl-ACP methyl ester esterase BioH [Pseudoalteromonas sp. XMcav2-N]
MQSEIVLLHGWGMNKQVWQLSAEQLQQAQALPVRAVNLPGFGGAAFPEHISTLDEVADDIAAQLNNNSVLVGWSLGGLVALNLAHRYPEKVAKLVLVASNPCFVEQPDWPGIKPKVLAGFKQALADDSAKTIERFLAIQAMGSEHARDDIKQLRQLLGQLPAPNSNALSLGLDALQSCDYRTEFGALSQPVFGLFGRLDALVPSDAIERMAALNPQFKAFTFSKASHAPFISHKDEFVTHLKSIL